MRCKVPQNRLSLIPLLVTSESRLKNKLAAVSRWPFKESAPNATARRPACTLVELIADHHHEPEGLAGCRLDPVRDRRSAQRCPALRAPPNPAVLTGGRSRCRPYLVRHAQASMLPSV